MGRYQAGRTSVIPGRAAEPGTHNRRRCMKRRNAGRSFPPGRAYGFPRLRRASSGRDRAGTAYQGGAENVRADMDVEEVFWSGLSLHGRRLRAKFSWR